MSESNIEKQVNVNIEHMHGNINLHETIEAIAKCVFTTGTLQLGANVSSGDFLRSLNKGFISEWSAERKPGSVFENLVSMIHQAIKQALDSVDFELSEVCKEELQKATFSFDNSLNYINSQNPTGAFISTIMSICSRFENCKVSAVLIETIAGKIVSYIDKELFNNHELSGLYIHLKMEKMSADINSIRVVMEQILNILVSQQPVSVATPKVLYRQEPRKDSAGNIIEFDRAIERYLLETAERYASAKTIYYTQAERKLVDFFVYPTLKFRAKNLHHKLQEVGSLYADDVLVRSQRVLILGKAGAGKTTLMKYWFVTTYERGGHIPFFIELRQYKHNSASLIKFVFLQITEAGYTGEQTSFETALKYGNYVFLCDGYDELSANNKKRLLNEIKALSAKYKNISFVVTSRPYENLNEFSSFEIADISPLTQEQSQELIKKLEADIEVKKRFIGSMLLEQFAANGELLSNPLMLTMMFLAYRNNEIIPFKLENWLEEIFETFFKRDTVLNNDYNRIFKSGLNMDEFRQCFSEICFNAYIESIFSFSSVELLSLANQLKSVATKIEAPLLVQDILNNMPLIIQDGAVYSFVHRSIQDYFAAAYVESLDDDEYIEVLKNLIETEKDISVIKHLRKLNPKRYAKNHFLMAFRFKEKQKFNILFSFFFPITWTKSDAGDHAPANSGGDYFCYCHVCSSYNKFLMDWQLKLLAKLNIPKLFSGFSSHNMSQSFLHQPYSTAKEYVILRTGFHI